MSARIATVLCIGLIAYLLWADRKRGDDVSTALWIPFLWIFFAGSRFAGQWLDLGPPEFSTVADYSEGSPTDRYVFLGLVLAGLYVLAQRKVDWEATILRNGWLVAFFLFAVFSVAWADEPMVALKRWIKGFGNVVMALVILTERRPWDALGVILRRLAYILVPLSVLFVRYYPELGRMYHMGFPSYTGVTFSKNSLGQLCLIVGAYLTWELLFARIRWPRATRRRQTLAFLLMFPLIGYLLYMADSATCNALIALSVGFLVLARARFARRNPEHLVVLLVVTAAVVIAAQLTIDLKSTVIQLLGRQPDLTTRVPVWELLVGMVPNAWVGAGYESFWTGERMASVWASLGSGEVGIIQAHNGYIETYLNLGIVGVCILVTALAIGIARAVRDLRADYPHAILRLMIIVAVVLYNYTEAAFKPLHNMFVLLLVAIIVVTSPAARRRQPAVELARPTLGVR